MSSCSTPWCAEYVSWQMAARMPCELAGGDGGADARAADQDRALGAARADRVADLARLVRVVDARLGRVGAEVERLVAEADDLLEDPLAQLHAAVVEGERDLHALVTLLSSGSS